MCFQKFAFSIHWNQYTENAIKVLRPHDRFQIVLPIHMETMKMTKNIFNLLLYMCIEGIT